MWSESETRKELMRVNGRLNYLKQHHSNGDDNPYGYGTVGDAKANLRHRKKELQARLKEIRAKEEYYQARSRALQRIFDRENDGIYPSDIGQHWEWRTENGVVYCVIDGKEFSEPVEMK